MRSAGVVSVIDLQTRELRAFHWVEVGCSELFYIQTLSGLLSQIVIGCQDDAVNGIMGTPKAVS